MPIFSDCLKPFNYYLLSFLIKTKDDLGVCVCQVSSKYFENKGKRWKYRMKLTLQTYSTTSTYVHLDSSTVMQICTSAWSLRWLSFNMYRIEMGNIYLLQLLLVSLQYKNIKLACPICSKTHSLQLILDQHSFDPFDKFQHFE